MGYSSDKILEGALKKAGEVPNNNSKFFTDALLYLNRVFRCQ
jgi:hypothetical protein